MSGIFKIFGKNTIFNEHPVGLLTESEPDVFVFDELLLGVDTIDG